MCQLVFVHCSFENKGRPGTWSWTDFPEGAGGKTVADFCPNLSCWTAGVVGSLGSLWREERPGYRPVRKDRRGPGNTCPGLMDYSLIGFWTQLSYLF